MPCRLRQGYKKYQMLLMVLNWSSMIVEYGSHRLCRQGRSQMRLPGNVQVLWQVSL